MDNINKDEEQQWLEYEKGGRRAKVLGGILLVILGSLFIAREMGNDLPHWLFSWKVWMIAFGLVLLVRHSFRRPGGFVLMLVGGAFLMTDMYPDLHLKPMIWPAALILLGLFLIFKPRNTHRCRNRWRHRGAPGGEQRFFADSGSGKVDSADFVDSTSFMAGVKKIVVSKNFRGGDITNVFGGTELDLLQADFETKASLEVTQVFGGTKLIVPANWQIRSELTTVFGSVEDHRGSPTAGDTGKILVLTGTTIFGGIEIQSV